MKHETTLEKYPGPWRFETIRDQKRGTSKTWLLDDNGNHIATIHGETREEAENMATLLCSVPEMLFSHNNQ